jgi:hypothetical protein
MPLLLLLGFGLFFADGLLGMLLSPWYYLQGIPIVRVRRFVPNGKLNAPTPGALEKRLRSLLLGNLVFADFGGLTYGFRPSLLWGSGSGILRCTIVFEPRESVLEVQGRLGWCLAGAIGLAALIALWEVPTDFGDVTVLFILVATGLGSLDVIHMFRVASVAQSLWGASEHSPAA